MRSVEGAVLDVRGIVAFEAFAHISAPDPSVASLEVAGGALPVALVSPFEVANNVRRRRRAGRQLLLGNIFLMRDPRRPAVALIDVHPRDGHVDAQEPVQPVYSVLHMN